MLAPFLRLGATLSETIKSKIQSKQYVELSVLANSNPLAQQTQFALTLNPNGSEPTWAVTNPKPAQIKTLQDWDKLFRIYCCLYTEAHPLEAPGLFTYISHIHDLARTKPGFLWRDYDIHFRTVRARSPGALPWDRFSISLLAELERQQEAGQPSTAAQGKKATGICHQFRYKGFCQRSQCPYLHTKRPATGNNPSSANSTGNNSSSANSQPATSNNSKTSNTSKNR